MKKLESKGKNFATKVKKTAANKVRYIKKMLLQGCDIGTVIERLSTWKRYL